MYPISDTVKALFEAEHRQVLRITGTDSNGNAISITDANVMMDGFEIDRTCCAGEKLEIGNAIASELTLKLDNRQNQFSDIGFEGAELFVEIGIADWTQTNPTVYWIPCGYFTCYEQPRTLNTITIHALDRMMRFDVEPTNLLAPWTDENGTPIEDGRGNIIYFQFDVKLPLTIQKIVAMVADGCGVPFDQDISGLPNANMQITSMPTLQQTITCRSFIQWCAGIMGTNAWIDWDGKLQFTRYNIATDYEMWPANRFSSDLHENDIVIKGISYTNTQDITIVSGNSDYRLDLTGNYLAAYNIAEILSNLRTADFDFYSYRPFTAEVIPAPYLWPMDKVVFMREKPNQPHVWDNINCVLTNVNIKLNGTTALESKGMTAEANSGVKQSGLTTEQAFAVEKATQVTKDLDESLNQEGIFNRLTDNGQTQGILLYNGKIYINASYIRAGTISADILKGGVLRLGGEDNTNGQIVVMDASGETVGEWDNNGLRVYKGTLSGPEIIVGQGNSGFISLLDNNGNEMFSIGNNQVNIVNAHTLYVFPEGYQYGAVGWTGTTSNGLSFYNGILYAVN